MRLKQGNIIKLDFDPIKGNEQSGFRPAVVVSGDTFNQLSSNVIVCPITNTNKEYPTHVALDKRTATTGFIMCDQIRTVSPVQRESRYIEDLPKDILGEVLDILKGILED
ncbi:MAG: type II toxin-antitoxin system PemK/MazF family toxin [Oscillospiraceae bacterium]|nr:type II toxin-antitoxin system PemK/MazF family toxin [Oscillospiraceae bacterium]